MNIRRALVPFACLVAGFLVGAFVYPGPYAYGNVNGATYRVNRLTGVEQWSSSRGWVSQGEMVQDSIGGIFGGLADGARQAGVPIPRPRP